MPRIESLCIQGYRSIRDRITIRFPTDAPLVLAGENNAGKSNIIRALDLVLGESWPGTREPEDHDFWDRNSSNGKIEIEARIKDPKPDKYGNPIEGFRWVYDASATGEKCLFRAITGSSDKYASKEMRDECICVVVGADRRLPYQLSYSTKWTLLSKLMRKFHDHLTADEDRVNRLKTKFEEIKGIFGEVDEFGGFQTELSKMFGEMFAGMSYGLQIDFSAYDPSNYFRSLRVLPVEGNTTRTFEELGTGQEQLLALAFAHAYAKAFHSGIVLAIEEPEAHLHPLAQQWLAKHIRQMTVDGLQVVLTTHSPAFVDFLGLEGIVLVRKTAGATTTTQLSAQDLTTFCVQRGANPQRTTAQTILSFYASHATEEITSGLFAKKVVLVEGPTEALSLPVYFAKAGFNVTKEGVAVIPVMGKGNLAKWWRLFAAYGIPGYVIFDNDTRRDDKEGMHRSDALRAIGIADGDIKRALGAADWEVFHLYCIFGQDFEAALKAHFPDYESLEKLAASSIGNAKPLIARQVVEHLSYDAKTTGWQRVTTLTDSILNLTAPESQPANNN